MKSAIFHGAGHPIAIEERPEGDCGPGEVRIGIARCGICGSDISMTSGTPFDYPVGRAIGHEFAGEVIETGRGVTALKTGDRVSVFPSAPCGTCEVCRAGRPLYCPNGVHLAGGFSERMVMPERAGFRLPESVSFSEGALVEPMACGRKALRAAGLAKGDKVLVIGAGSMALSAVWWARLGGAGRIVVATRSDKRDAIAMEMGADAALRLDNEDPQAIELALGGPPDIVVEAVGKPGMLSLAMDKVRMGGAVASMGMCSVPDTVLPITASLRDVSLHFTMGYSIEDYAETLRSFDAGKVRPETMVSETIALDALPAMMEAMRTSHDHLKVHVAPCGCG